jgi:integrase
MAKNTRARRGKRLPPNVVAHRGKFRALVMVNGKRVASQVAATPEEAAAMAAKIREAGELSQHGAPLTLATAMDLLRREQVTRGVRPGSVAFTEQQFKSLGKAWPVETTHLHRIGAPQVERYMEVRRAKVGPQTIHHEVALLKRLFKVGKRHQLLLRSPFDDGRVQLPKVRNRRFDHLTREEIESLLERIRAVGEKEAGWAWQADVIEFLFLTGLRRAELARLRAEDLDAFKGTMKIAGKTEDEVRPLAERTKAIATRLIASADEHGFVIPSEENSETGRANAITHLVARWKARLGLNLHGAAHVLRHSYCTALVKVPGIPFATVQLAMRHKTPAMTMHYYHADGEEMRNAAEAVATGALPTPKAKPQKQRKPRRSRAKSKRAEPKSVAAAPAAM